MTGMSLMEFIESREAEIKEIRKSLYLELKQLKAAKAAINGDAAASAYHNDSPSDHAAELTIKEMAISVLDALQRPLSAEEILVEIGERFSRQLQRTSLSPQLSRLRKEGKVHYDSESGRWERAGGVGDTLDSVVTEGVGGTPDGVVTDH